MQMKSVERRGREHGADVFLKIPAKSY